MMEQEVYTLDEVFELFVEKCPQEPIPPEIAECIADNFWEML